MSTGRDAAVAAAVAATSRAAPSSSCPWAPTRDKIPSRTTAPWNAREPKGGRMYHRALLSTFCSSPSPTCNRIAALNTVRRLGDKIRVW